jgi:8-oxo-dGTP pyrophosphatase MutT (NUDIX family)
VSVPVDRRAARVVLVDAAGRVLLQHCQDPAGALHGHWWNTTGGGLDPGETPQQAAVRELHEEVGLRLDPAALGPVVHRRTTEFSFGGQAYRQAEDYFLVRVDGHEVVPTHLTEIEAAAVLGYAWWSVEELRSSDQRIYPEELPELLDALAPGTAA